MVFEVSHAATKLISRSAMRLIPSGAFFSSPPATTMTFRSVEHREHPTLDLKSRAISDARPPRRGIGLSGVCRGRFQRTPPRHAGMPAMSNQCQLNFSTRLLSPDSRRVSTPDVRMRGRAVVHVYVCRCGGGMDNPLGYTR